MLTRLTGITVINIFLWFFHFRSDNTFTFATTSMVSGNYFDIKTFIGTAAALYQ